MSQNIQHSSHEHILTYSNPEYGYRCNVCREDGMGWNYRCHACNFDVHPFCARAPWQLYHPFHNYSGHQLTFIPRPPWQNPRPCSACGHFVEGYGYHCAWGSCGYVLHPSCAQLPERLSLPSPVGYNEQTLQLFTCLTSPCCWCGQGASGWAYANSPRTYNIHVGCAKRLLDGSVRRLELARAAARPSSGPVVMQQPSSRAVVRQPRGHAGNAGNRGFDRFAKIMIRTIFHAIVGNPLSLAFDVWDIIDN